MRYSIAFCIVLIFICACSVDKNNEEIKKTGEVMKTHCIGRHVIALPIKFSAMPIVTGIFKERNLEGEQGAIEVVVNRRENTFGVFDRELEKRRAEIAYASDEGVNILRSEKRIGDNAVIFRVQEIDDAYFSEMILSRRSALIKLRLASYHNQYSSAEERLLQFSERVMENKVHNVIDARDGFCLGKITIAGDYSVESGDFLFRDQAGADFDIKIDSYKQDERIGLLSRMSAPNSLLKTFRVDHSVMRARKTIIAGMQAEEWLGWTMQGRDANKKVFGFTMETNRPFPSKATPKITVSFDSGLGSLGPSPINTSITDETALALWDSVVHSISSEHMMQQ